MVVSIQTFGDLVNFHPHLHCLVADGCFIGQRLVFCSARNRRKEAGNSISLQVVKMLAAEKKIGNELVESFFAGKISGFSVHHQVKIQSGDHRGRESLAQYILRSPFSLEKMIYQRQNQTVIYRSQMNPVLKKNFAVFSALD